MYTTLSVVIIVQPVGLADGMQDPLRFTDKDGMWGGWHFLSDFKFVGGEKQCESKAIKSKEL